MIPKRFVLHKYFVIESIRMRKGIAFWSRLQHTRRDRPTGGSPISLGIFEVGNLSLFAKRSRRLNRY
ncbi:MAG: hypothetical protein LBK82_13480 [Planctomycetaceae bacterium]|nr:hypothetical protein [Planctomycetaceae bacterium]